MSSNLLYPARMENLDNHQIQDTKHVQEPHVQPTALGHSENPNGL